MSRVDTRFSMNPDRSTRRTTKRKNRDESRNQGLLMLANRFKQQKCRKMEAYTYLYSSEIARECLEVRHGHMTATVHSNTRLERGGQGWPIQMVESYIMDL